MTSTERKRTWRLRHPEQSREAERNRSDRRRVDWNGSYHRHEQSMARLDQRLWYPIRGAGGRHMTAAEGRAAIDARFKAEWAAMNVKFGTNEPFPK